MIEIGDAYMTTSKDLFTVSIFSILQPHALELNKSKWHLRLHYISLQEEWCYYLLLWAQPPVAVEHKYHDHMPWITNKLKISHTLELVANSWRCFYAYLCTTHTRFHHMAQWTIANQNHCTGIHWSSHLIADNTSQQQSKDAMSTKVPLKCDSCLMVLKIVLHWLFNNYSLLSSQHHQNGYEHLLDQQVLQL